ncbi:type IX secretion system membrane protein PorP/SprF [Winogradskyella sp.]|uniref:PorP/SprF family type IX secretion system membrane protein n=1 Tax=Winogradskyella sp. TaxID=1883156 RepID=UPI00261B6468|nr:type IX secretion system membrane protein PorP/SprF [Winogradskyella sp.]
MLLIFFGMGFSGHAQQDSQYTQYMYNTQTINPAYAGNRGMLSINGLYRNQWVGLDGAPETLNFSLNTPVGRKVGLGFSFFSDEIGPSKEQQLAIDVSYSIKISENTKLAFGVKGGFNLLDVNFSELNFNPADPNAQNVNNQLSPLVGAGVYWHHSDKWYIGVSVPNLLETDHYDDVVVSTASERATFYAIAGYVFDLSDNVKLKPAVLGKATSGAPLAVDLTANVLFHNKFTLGAAYRWDAAVSGLAAFQVTDQIMVGYAYDFDTTDLGNYNSGSHEIFLRFELINRTKRVVSPRFF